MVSATSFNSFFHGYQPNPLIAFGVSSLCALKTSAVFSKKINQLPLSLNQQVVAKITTVCVLQTIACISCMYSPLASTLFFISGYVALTVLPVLGYKHSLEEMRTKKIQDKLALSQNPIRQIKALEELTVLGDSVLTEQVQIARAKLINEHPEIPTMNLFHSVEDMLAFAATYGISKLNLTEATLKKGELKKIVDALPDLAYLDFSTLDFSTRDEEIKMIMSKLHKLTHLKISNSFVSSEVLKLIPRNMPLLEHLNLCGCEKVSDQVMEQITLCLPHLTYLNLEGCKALSHISFDLIALRLKKIKELYLGLTSLNDEGMKKISSLPELTSLDVFFCHRLKFFEFRETALSLKNLTHLNLARTSINDTSIKVIAENMQKLVSLDMSVCSKISDDSLKEITNKLPGIKRLSLLGCKGISPAGIKEIAEKLVSLVHLKISNLDLSCLKAISSHLSLLEELAIESCKEIDFAGINEIVKLKKLKKLTISRCPKITPKCIEIIGQNLSQLIYLDLSRCKIGKEGIKYLARYLKKLMHLDICACLDDYDLEIYRMIGANLPDLMLFSCDGRHDKSVKALFPYTTFE